MRKLDAQIERASAITDHMRIFGRSSTDVMKPLSATAMIDASLHLIGEQLRLQNIDVFVNIESPEIMFIGHQVQIEQVMLNLLGNARDVLKSSELNNRSIKVSAGLNEQNNTVNIEIQDNGGGIDPAVLPHIFEPFYTTKEVGDGTGLGLSISYGIISDMDGKLEARNCEGGACFTITLPAHKDD